jgi:hypothetical protein
MKLVLNDYKQLLNKCIKCVDIIHVYDIIFTGLVVFLTFYGGSHV